ncbi:MAG: hypothetical protein ACWA5W_11365 [Phycisphaerales bacterium]
MSIGLAKVVNCFLDQPGILRAGFFMDGFHGQIEYMNLALRLQSGCALAFG